MGATEFYDPNQVQFSIGSNVITGFAPGSMIEVEPAADLFNEVVGTKGDVGIARIYNPLVTIKVKLLQTSASNDDLSALVLASSTSTASGIASPGSLADMSGTTKVSGMTWAKKRPNVSFSDTVETREWTLTMKTDTHTIGGNTAVA
jgi:hypothetical protein